MTNEFLEEEMGVWVLSDTCHLGIVSSSGVLSYDKSQPFLVVKFPGKGSMTIEFLLEDLLDGWGSSEKAFAVSQVSMSHKDQYDKETYFGVIYSVVLYYIYMFNSIILGSHFESLSSLIHIYQFLSNQLRWN